ncbi:MAG: segregation/condensation protein A [Methanosarcinales archaeon]|uniref:Segregation/condensation protein A n=1 Tax=Candidatus Ethanoperedens thermophilum TaxID=2766897 RepID=A0A848D5E1_9EURY|nr:segregation/condensation protein A [Candidatus Ethanoperedens thermophilum]
MIKQSITYLGIHNFMLDVQQDPTEILVNMAKNDEIDPWHIDIVEVTDRFLKRIEQLELLDLRISGRTLFYASVLLKMKSNTLIEPDLPEDEEDFFDGVEFADAASFPIPTPPMRHKSVRPATLDELIAELKKAEVVERRRQTRVPDKKTNVKKIGTDEVISIAHEEGIEKKVAQIYKKLDELFKTGGNVNFNELLLQSGDDKIMTFIALLFLAGDKKIWLEQPELFGELLIYKRAKV